MKYTTNKETLAYMTKSDAAIKTVREEVWNQFNNEPGEGISKDDWRELGASIRTFLDDLNVTRVKLFNYYYAANISIDFLQRLIDKLPGFAGKVYNVRLDNAIKTCFSDTLDEARKKETVRTIKGYVDFSNYDLHCLRFNGSLGWEEHITFPLEFKILVNPETNRIVSVDDMQPVIYKLKAAMKYLESQVKEVLKSLHNMQKESILRKIVQSTIKVKRELVKQDALIASITSPKTYHYKRTDYNAALPKYNR
jgi:hypothetical protein